MSESDTSEMVLDPLTRLPPETVLNILEFVHVSGIASLTRVSKAWHHFIDYEHQDMVYSHASKTSRPPDARDFAYLEEAEILSTYFHGIESWKDCCKRQTLLKKEWEMDSPAMLERVLDTKPDVWRFKPDFKRGFCITTHFGELDRSGGLQVVDLRSRTDIIGGELWRNDQVRAYAHLEYDDGTMVFDSGRNTLEIWKTDMPGLTRGEFRKTGTVEPRCDVKGFQLSFGSLCVIASDGEGYIYNLKAGVPTLQTEMMISRRAVGHLAQNAEVVMYSDGAGYAVHEKITGRKIGYIDPKLFHFACYITRPNSGA
nr:hypothetical protein CFP56_31028 [Quercus suber]